jgi:hypothetical protein
VSQAAREVERSIDGVAKTVAGVLANQKYSIDYYQREYKWESKQMAELVADLTTKFLEIHEPGHARKDVAWYPGYYLGSIIISQKGSEPFVVDGQQRLTSLTLLLTFLRRLQTDRSDRVNVDPLIFSEKYGEKSFNLDVPDRKECMKALFDHGVYDPKPTPSPTTRNLSAFSSRATRSSTNCFRESCATAPCRTSLTGLRTAFSSSRSPPTLMTTPTQSSKP